MSSVLEIGKKLVDLSNQNKSMEAVNTLYSNDIVSIEAGGPPGENPKKEGIAAIRGKHDWWEKNHTTHSSVAKGPWPHGDRFIVTFAIDVTAKAGPMAGKRFTMEEAALYTVKDGKIVKEEFFYSMGG